MLALTFCLSPTQELVSVDSGQAAGLVISTLAVRRGRPTSTLLILPLSFTGAGVSGQWSGSRAGDIHPGGQSVRRGRPTSTLLILPLSFTGAGVSGQWAGGGAGDIHPGGQSVRRGRPSST